MLRITIWYNSLKSNKFVMGMMIKEAAKIMMIALESIDKLSIRQRQIVLVNFLFDLKVRINNRKGIRRSTK